MPFLKTVLDKLEYFKVLDIVEKYAGSSLARQKIKSLTPSNFLPEIERRQEETSEATDVLRLYPNFSIGVIRDIREILRKVELGISLEPNEFLQIADNIRTGRRVKSFFKDKEKNWEILNDRISKIYSLNELSNEISRVITEEGNVSENASPRLREIRRSINRTHSRIKDYLNRVISSTSMQKKLQENIVTIRGDRYVIPVKQEYRSQVKGLVHDQSSSGATVFIEPIEVVELNNRLKELTVQEKNEIEKILKELTGFTAHYLEPLKSSLEALVDLDFIFAKAYYSLNIKAVRPQFNQKGIIRLKKARHPLIDKDVVVPISFKMGDDYNTVIITGPNTGGKTVSLKTIGLLSIMAQSGLHVPAEEGSTVAVFEGIYADIGDEQSIEQSLSTFSSHMRNIIEIIKVANSKSLVLLDELGAGTDPTEGAALAMAILSYLHKNNVKVLATTHYGQLKNFAYNTPGVQNASVEFDSESLKPTYRLLMGLPGKSNALEISLRLGLKREIIDIARNYLGTEELKASDLIGELEKERRISEKERQEAEKYRKEVEDLKVKLQEEKRELENKKKEILAKAASEAREIVKRAQDEAKEILKNLRHTKEIEQSQKRLREIDKELKEKSKIELTPKGKVPKEVKPGDTVEVPKLNGKGKVLTQVNEAGEVQVQIGLIKVNVKLKDLRVPLDSGTDKEDDKRLSLLVSQKSKSISPELDLRGNTVEEAIESIDKYLDDAYIAGLKTVSIIHGKGTGALRAGVREYLKKHPHVKKYRYGEAAEGGNGVTVVELK